MSGKNPKNIFRGDFESGAFALVWPNANRDLDIVPFLNNSIRELTKLVFLRSMQGKVCEF